MLKKFFINLICFLVAMVIFVPVNKVNAYEVKPLYVEDTTTYYKTNIYSGKCRGEITGYVVIQLCQTPTQGAYLRISNIYANVYYDCSNAYEKGKLQTTKSVGTKVTPGSSVILTQKVYCPKHGTKSFSIEVSGW